MDINTSEFRNIVTQCTYKLGNSTFVSTLPQPLMFFCTDFENNAEGIEAITRISPVAGQHILLNGHYTFQSSNKIIGLDALVTGLKLG